MDMGETERFAAFVQEINNRSAEINGMPDAEVQITEALKMVVLLEGVRLNHKETFQIVVSHIEHQTGPLNYQKAVNMMMTAATQHDHDDAVAESANKAAAARRESAKVATEDARKHKKVPAPCYRWQGYGRCDRKGCKFDHSGKKGTKKCEKCDGPHHADFCKQTPG